MTMQPFAADLTELGRRQIRALTAVADTCKARDAGQATDDDVRRAEAELATASRAYFLAAFPELPTVRRSHDR